MKRRRRLRLVGALIALVLLGSADGSAGPAEGGGDRAESHRHFLQAEDHFKLGRFTEALAEYEAGYRLAPLPGFLINIAHCHRLMGDLRKARAYYRKFILISPQSPRRREVEDLIQELGKAITDENGSDPDANGAAVPDKPVKPPSARWWVWTALAASVVGSTVVSLAGVSDPPGKD